MTWDPKLQIAVANWTTPHECVRWDTLDAWAADRHVDMTLPNVIEVENLGMTDAVDSPATLTSSRKCNPSSSW